MAIIAVSRVSWQRSASDPGQSLQQDFRQKKPGLGTGKISNYRKKNTPNINMEIMSGFNIVPGYQNCNPGEDAEDKSYIPSGNKRLISKGREAVLRAKKTDAVRASV